MNLKQLVKSKVKGVQKVYFTNKKAGEGFYIKDNASYSFKANPATGFLKVNAYKRAEDGRFLNILTGRE